MSRADFGTLVTANTAFAIDAYKELGRKFAGENVVFSPYSISLTMAMVSAGARGPTADEIAAAMHFALPPERLHPAFDSLDLALNDATGGGVTVESAHSLWASPEVLFVTPFLDTIAQNYGSRVRLTHFAADPEGSRKLINGWIDSETHHKIHDFAPPKLVDERTLVVLVDANYFYGQWADAFPKEGTYDEPFVALDGDAREVRMMHVHDVQNRFAQNDGYDAVELPYKQDEFVMDIIMPKGSFAAFESNVTGPGLGSLLDGMKRGRIWLSMPRFTLRRETFSLKKMLEGLGVHLAFDPDKADFWGMATKPASGIYFNEVIHQGYIAVDEEGTEAASATLASGMTTASPPQAFIEIDHPFLFLIRHRPTQTILFAGRVTNPLAN